MKTQDIKSKENNYAKPKIKIWHVIVLVGMILILFAEITIPIINNHYFKPKKFKQTLFEGLRSNPDYIEISDEILQETVNCICEGFDELHGIGNYPTNEIYTKQDVKLIFTCHAKHLLKGEEQKFFYEHMDSLVNVYFVPSTP